MKSTTSFIIFLLLFTSILSVKASKVDEILKEGQLLYRLEKGSWFGTDDFLERFASKQKIMGGYLSYESKNHKIITIFYTKDTPAKIIVRYTFDSIPSMIPLHIDTTNCNLTETESDLITIRNDAIDRMTENKNKLFSYYKNTSFNLIPLIYEKKKKVYVITASDKQGVFLLGNDYLLEYNNKNKFKSEKKLHNTLIEFSYGSDENGNNILMTMHSHVINDYIDVTDICSLLLYKEYTTWEQHYVMSKKYVTIFDLKKESIVIMSIDAWNKIIKDVNSKDKTKRDSLK